MAAEEDKEAYKEAAVWHYVNQIIEEEGETLETTATPQFISALADMVYAQAEAVAVDLESFAGHAKRSVINVEDVKLCCRRNEGLGDVIQEYIEGIERKKRLEKENASERDRGRRASGTARGRGRGRGGARNAS